MKYSGIAGFGSLQHDVEVRPDLEAVFAQHAALGTEYVAGSVQQAIERFLQALPLRRRHQPADVAADHLSFGIGQRLHREVVRLEDVAVGVG